MRLVALKLCPALLALALLPSAHAMGPACSARHPPPETLAAMFDMAAATAQTLDAQDGVDVAIAARGGQDLTRYGLRHSHLAIVLRDAAGQWQALHLLNRCKSDSSQLYREGLVNLVGESALHTDLRVGIPSAPVRAALRALPQGDASAARVLHQPRYSMLAWPGGDDYQNSNQWVLEVVAAAIAQARDGQHLDNRAAARRWLAARHFQPSVLHIGLGKRLGARWFADNVAVSDHPARERISGNYSVVTVESVFDFLQQQHVLEREMAVSHRPVPAAAAAGDAPP